MNYSRPWMFSGLALMAAGAFLLWHQGPQPSALADQPKATHPAEASPAKKSPLNTAEPTDPYQWKNLFDR